ncbi:MAG: dolichyl-phosphate-mannose-protein mannosyltransferase family protein [Proteobacteria bacterium]|nr:dolichyl-phosphate-mannose-protein mannosyltransferase family protein [Pseudomonadota bacterium]
MDFRLPPWLKPGLMLAVVACLLVFITLNRADLSGSTEPREAGVAAEMLQSHNFLLPSLNGEPFLEKPPLSYWLQAASIGSFGYQAFAPRLPSALAAIATVLLFAFFYRKSNQKDWHILLSGTLLITMGAFLEYAQTAGQDMLLAFGVSLAVLSFYFTREDGSKALWLGFSAGIAVATLAKGVVGLAVPGIVVLSYLLIESFHFDQRFTLSKWVRPALFSLLGLLPILAWLALIFATQGIEPVREVVWANSVGRFQGDYSGGAHAEPFYFYLKNLPQSFQPWSFLLYIAIWQSLKVLKIDRRRVFLLCWLVAPLVLLSLSAGKRPSYLLMIYPAAAAFLADYLVSFIQTSSETTAKAAKVAKWLAAMQASIFSGALFYVVFRLVQIGLPGVAGVSLLLAGLPLYFMWRSVPQLRVFHLLAGAVGVLLVTSVAYYGLVTPHDGQLQSAKRVMDPLALFSGAGRPVALYQPSERMRGAASFYLQHRVPTIATIAQLHETLARQPDTVVLADESSGQLDLDQFKDEGQVRYGRTRYRYLSGKRIGSAG